MFFKARVIPTFIYNTIYCNPVPLTNIHDSVIFHAYQYTFHKNRPTDVYYWGGGGYGDRIYGGNGTGGYPMGKYNIEMDIWKSGMHTTLKDSIYLGWGDTITATINW